ncbi:MAG: YeeE/YedE family protein [Crocinitomicaceae bacterium]|nr:YeeE/YedE family protein [Crocinitomicaceae bacterium]
MKFVKFFLVGIVFGIVMTKSEIISWLRIYEMFKFKSFHMYGIIGSAVVLGIIQVLIIKKGRIKTMYGTEIIFTPKAKQWTRYIVGGTIFGLGWALIGACPGPMFTLIGTGAWVFLFVIVSATIGTFVYGILRDKLPH